MSALRARVEKGRPVLDEPRTLPEGTVVDLVVDDEGDELTSGERRALHEALLASWKSAEACPYRKCHLARTPLKSATFEKMKLRTC